MTFGAEPVSIDVEMTEIAKQRIPLMPEKYAGSFPFHPNVCRIVLFHGIVHLHDIEGDVRPPHPEELPDTTLLTYGTSITHGAVATLGLSVNMANQGYTIERFRKRISYFVETVSGTGRPVACISLFPYFADWSGSAGNILAHPDEFRRALKEVVAELDRPILHFIPGSEILTDYTGLTTDLLHPSDLGMIEMGRNLAEKIRPLMDKAGESGGSTVRSEMSRSAK